MVTNKSQLIDELSLINDMVDPNTMDLAVRTIIERMSQTMEQGDRIEIRGFGSFSLRKRMVRTARNPKTGENLTIGPKAVVHFKPGKQLRALVDDE